MAHDAALDGAPPPLDEWEVADDDEALADAESNEPESEPEPSVPQPLRRRGASPARGRVATSPQTRAGRRRASSRPVGSMSAAQWANER